MNLSRTQVPAGAGKTDETGEYSRLKTKFDRSRLDYPQAGPGLAMCRNDKKIQPDAALRPEGQLSLGRQSDVNGLPRTVATAKQGFRQRILNEARHDSLEGAGAETRVVAQVH